MGVIIRNGINYSNESFVEITQAQYDALSEDEKMNGTVYIVDDGLEFTAKDVPYENTTVKDALDSNFNYYIDQETVCGKWHDGKPLYKRFIRLTGTPIASGTPFPHNIANIKEIINVNATMMDRGTAYPYPLVGVTGKVLTVKFNTTNFYFQGDDDWSDQNNRWHYFVIVYTKTTD